LGDECEEGVAFSGGVGGCLVADVVFGGAHGRRRDGGGPNGRECALSGSSVCV
jgi:hypothetical protein